MYTLEIHVISHNHGYQIYINASITFLERLNLILLTGGDGMIEWDTMV